MTITFCIDRDREFQAQPGWHVNRWGKRIRSVRIWWGPAAVAWYRFNDYHLVAEPHEWSDS